MKTNAQTISAYDVIYDVVPKLDTVEKLVGHTLDEALNTQELESIARTNTLKMEFQLELTMIRMNLEHLLKRYQKELNAVVEDRRRDQLLTLDAFEAVAIESAAQLYRRVQVHQKAD